MSDFIADHRRLYILQFLAQQPGYKAESGAVRAHLSQAHFLDTPLGTLAADLVKLKNLGLVILLGEGAGAKLTSDGLEAANGVTEYPGVARPLPE